MEHIVPVIQDGACDLHFTEQRQTHTPIPFCNFWAGQYKVKWKGDIIEIRFRFFFYFYSILFYYLYHIFFIHRGPRRSQQKQMRKCRCLAVASGSFSVGFQPPVVLLFREFPGCGNIITFAQFLFIAMEGFIFETNFGRKKPAIPLG